MRFARLGPVAEEIPVLLDGEGVLDLRPVTDDIDGQFLATGGLERTQRAADAGQLPPLEGTSGLRIGAPIARPSAVIGVGLNYAAHAAESGAAPSEAPVVFLKTPNTVAGPNDAVPLLPGSTHTDWEVELGVVIGTRAHLLPSPETSLSHVAGFVAADDVSERSYQIGAPGGQWTKGKSAPGFAPTGPWLATTEEIDFRAVRLRSWVNGAIRQDSRASDMIFGVEFLVWHLSQYLALEPGDLVLTGTPEGVAVSGRFPYLRAGDVVEIEIEGLGRQRHVMASSSQNSVGAE